MNIIHENENYHCISIEFFIGGIDSWQASFPKLCWMTFFESTYCEEMPLYELGSNIAPCFLHNPVIGIY